MKHLFIYTEEPSIKIVFDRILTQILSEDIAYRIFVHQGKNDLIYGIKNTLPKICKIPDSRILITRDQDSADCKKIKVELDTIVKTICARNYKIRIICRELESWFLGDMDAIAQAYPRFHPEQYRNKKAYRNVDLIQSPSKHLLKLIPEFAGSKKLPKISTAEAIATHLDINANQSESFNQTLSAIQYLCK